jgi:hypothetical protein
VLRLVDSTNAKARVATLVEASKHSASADTGLVVERLVVALDELSSAVDQAFFLRDLPWAVATNHRAQVYPVLSRLLNAGTAIGREELLGIVTKVLPLCVAVATRSNTGGKPEVDLLSVLVARGQLDVPRAWLRDEKVPQELRDDLRLALAGKPYPPANRHR